MTLIARLQHCLKLANNLMQLLSKQNPDEFDEQLPVYLENFKLLEEEFSLLSSQLESGDYDFLNQLQQIHHIILTQVVMRKKQVEDELLVLQKKNKAATSYQRT